MRKTQNKATNKMGHNTVQAEESLEHSIYNDILRWLIQSAVLIWHNFLQLHCLFVLLFPWGDEESLILCLSFSQLLNSAQQIRLCRLYSVHMNIRLKVSTAFSLGPLGVCPQSSSEQVIHCTTVHKNVNHLGVQTPHSCSEGLLPQLEKNCLIFCTSIFTTLCVVSLCPPCPLFLALSPL